MKRAATLLSLLLLTGAPVLCLALTAPEQQQFADGLYSRNMHDLAIKEYQRILAEFPSYEKSDLVLYRLAESLRKTGKAAEALAAYQKVSDAHPTSTMVHRSRLRIVELKVAANDHAGALSIIGQLLTDKPGGEVEAATLYYHGLCLQKSGRGDAARLAYGQLVERFPATPHAGYARLEMAKLLNAGGPGANDEQVAALYLKTAEQPPSPRAGAEALLALADFQFTRQKFAESAAAFGRLRATYPDHPVGAELWIKAAWANFNSRQYPAALDLLGKLPAEARTQFGADALYLEANCLRQTQREQDALARYAELAQKFPQSEYAPFASYETALVAYQRKDFASVIAQAQQMKREPKLALDASWLHARALEQTGKPQDAAAEFARIAESFKDSPRAPEALFEAARIQQDRGKLGEAAGIFRALADQFPKHDLAAKALYAAAVCEVKQDRLEPAAADWGRLLANYPAYELAAEATFQKGLAEMKLQKLEPAEKSFAALLAHPKAEPRQIGEASYWLAMILEQQKKFPEAEKYLRDALGKLGKHDLVPKTQYRLALVLQKQGKEDEAADLVQGVLESPLAGDLDPALLEWLVRRRLDGKAFDKAATAADLMARNAKDPRWKQLAFTLAGQARVALGKPADAVAPYTQAFAIATDTRERVESALFLGEHHRGAKDFAKAADLFGQGAELASRLSLLQLQARGYLGLGRTAEDQSKWEDAARYFMSIAVLYDDPELSPEALLRAARAYKALNRAADAERTHAELKQRYPQSTWAAQAL